MRPKKKPRSYMQPVKTPEREAMWFKKPAKSTQSTKDKNCQAESSENGDYKSQVLQAYQDQRRPRTSQMCSDKKSQETSHMQPVMPVIVNTEDNQLSTPIIRRLCQDENANQPDVIRK